MSRPRQVLILGCLLLSGLSGLAYEILWTRGFGLVFGTVAVSVSAVLAAFFLGLAAGGDFGAAVHTVEQVRRFASDSDRLEAGWRDLRGPES